MLKSSELQQSVTTARLLWQPHHIILSGVSWFNGERVDFAKLRHHLLAQKPLEWGSLQWEGSSIAIPEGNFRVQHIPSSVCCKTIYCMSSLNQRLGEVHSVVVLSEGLNPPHWQPGGFAALCRTALYPAQRDHRCPGLSGGSHVCINMIQYLLHCIPGGEQFVPVQADGGR